MENVIYLLFVCIVAPLVLMLALLESKSRRTVGFMIIGMFLCVFVSEINGLLNNILGMCANATNYANDKEIRKLGLKADYYSESDFESLSNYQDFINAGWTIGADS